MPSKAVIKYQRGDLNGALFYLLGKANGALVKDTGKVSDKILRERIHKEIDEFLSVYFKEK